MKLLQILNEGVFKELDIVKKQLSSSMKEYLTSVNEVTKYFPEKKKEISMINKSLVKLDQEIQKIIAGSEHAVKEEKIKQLKSRVIKAETNLKKSKKK